VVLAFAMGATGYEVVFLGWQPSRLNESCSFAPHLRKWFALYASTPMLPPCALPRHFFRQNAVGLYFSDLLCPELHASD